MASHSSFVILIQFRATQREAPPGCWIKKS